MKRYQYAFMGFVAVITVPAFALAQAYYPIGSPVYPSGSSYGPYVPITTPTSGACVALTQDLSYGSKGSEVTALQTFIVSSSLPGTGSWMITGYYGRATESAVRSFQSQQGLPSTGSVDSNTRSVIQRVSCGYSSGTTYPYSAYSYNPYYPNTNWYSSPSYSGPTYYVPQQYTYVSPYTYSGSVYTGYTGCSGGYYNHGGCSSPVISYLSPSSGSVGSTVTVYGNGFSYRNNTVHFGTGIIANLSSNDGRSVSFTVPSQLVGYGNQPVYLGSYNVSVTNAAGYTSSAAPYVVTGLASGGNLSVTGISGPTSLLVGQQGNWSVSVRQDNSYYSNDTYLTTSVRWGDEGYYGYASNASAQSTLVRGPQALSFTHVYQQPGTYTITVTTTDNYGRSTSASATVVVTNNQQWYW